jgi:hypothetical protein
MIMLHVDTYNYICTFLFMSFIFLCSSFVLIFRIFISSCMILKVLF